MGKTNRKRKRKSGQLERLAGNLQLRNEGVERTRKIVFGLSQIDNAQGQSFEDWETYQLLAKALSRFQGICSMTIDEAKQKQIIKTYGTQMPEGSAFVRPKHIAEDTVWCSIRIQAKIRIIGYIESNYIFQVVFLDKNHEFYPSNKKHT